MAIYDKEFTDEEIRVIQNEFQRLGDKIYLDHAGTALYSEAQIDCVSNLLKQNLFCNPHTCKITGDLVDQVRYKVLNYFNTNPENYDVVFTGNASQALKTVAECFDFGGTGCFYYCQENHTSVLGMREVVQTNDIFVLSTDEIVENICEEKSDQEYKNFTGNSLIAFSAQCNFSGYKMPLSVIDVIKNNGLKNHGKRVKGTNKIGENSYYVCLDAASFAATNFLDLSKYTPDFVCISFYKIFGYPTGLGALIVNKRSQDMLVKKFFGGGTVKISLPQQDFHVKRDSITEKFEDGTLSFLGIASVLEGFKTIERLIPNKDGFRSQQRISKHVFNLAKYFYESLKDLKHPTGQDLIEFYNHTNYISHDKQGGFVCFNISNDDGSYVGFAEVACIAAVHNIILRTGCFCNVGACQYFLKLKNEDLIKHFKAGHVCSDYNDLIDGQPTGAVRISFGYITQKSDVDFVIDIIKKCYLKQTFERRAELIISKPLPAPLTNVQKRFGYNHIKLIKICIYPIKSCGPFEIVGNNKWELSESGLKYDRLWMIVDSNGMAVTQKQQTKLCLIKPVINLNSNELELNFLEYDPIKIPLEVDENIGKNTSATFCQSKVCGDSIQGIDCGDYIADWLSKVLSIPGLRLIKQSNNFERKTKDGLPKDINLSNQAQFLLINKTSVSWLADKVEEWENDENKNINNIIKRFRPNLVIETLNPLEENDFESLQIGCVDFKLEGPCTRCQMICIDPNTGCKTTEPLKTIAKEFKGKIKFGIYLSLKSLIKDEKKRFLSCEDKIIFTAKSQ